MTAEHVLPESSRLSGNHRNHLKSGTRPQPTRISPEWGSRLMYLFVFALVIANLLFWSISFSR